MSSMLRSAAVMVLVSLPLTGCAARVGGHGNARMGASLGGGATCGGGYSGSGMGSATAGGMGSATAGGMGSATAGGTGSATANGSATASGGVCPCASGNGGASASAGGAASGGATASGGGGVLLPLPGLPQFYGIPLSGAEDVVFVLDRSDSMSGSAAGAPSSPLAAFATAGYSAFSSFQGGAQALPTTPAAFSSALAAWAPLQLSALPAQTAPSKMDAAKAELVSALSTLPDGTRFGVVFFNERVDLLAPGLTSMAPGSRWTSVSFVHGIAPSGTTAAVPALRQAYAARPRRVVFLSDGLANTGGDGATLLAEARLAMRHGVRFDTVGVGNDQDAPMLRAMAAESGGIAVSR